MAKKPRTPAEATSEDTTANQQNDGGAQDTTSVTGGPEVNEGNPPTGAGLPAPEHRDEQESQDPQGEPGPDEAPTQAEKDADRKALSNEEALQLLRAGHRLRFKGDDPSAWVAMSRHGGDLAVSFAATDAEVDDLLSSGDLILAD